MYRKKLKIVVTGGYGQLGRSLQLLTDRYPELEFLFTDIDTFDITKEREVDYYFSENNPVFVINCAAYTAVDKAERDEENARCVNAFAPAFLAAASRKTGAGFLHVSTDYVFDGNAFVPYAESDAVNPRSVYGKTKLEGERLVVTENPGAVIVRTSWLYSPFGNNFAKTMMKLGSEKEEVRVVYDQTGTPTYAPDLAEAIMIIVESFLSRKEGHLPGIYHYSNEGVASWFDFTQAIFNFTGSRCRVIPVLSAEFQTDAQRPHYTVLNKSKIKTTFNLQIPYWRQSLNVCVDNLLNR